MLPAAPATSTSCLRRSPAIAVDRIVKIVCHRIPKRFGADPVRDIQVLCPMNRGAVGAVSLNTELQRALNPARTNVIEKFGRSFASGDKVMQIENDYDREVYNGDIGHVDQRVTGRRNRHRGLR